MALVSQIKLPDNSQHNLRASAIPYGIVDASSTSTAYTATVPGITALEDGVTCMLKNGVVTSASGFEININGLGAKPVYNSMAAATADTTIFNINYTMLFVYDSTRVSGGCWICYRGYNSDNNTIGYQIRTNSTAMPTTTRTRYYRILFTSADNTHWVPANTGYDNSATSKKTVNTVAINPFGRIVYMTGTTNVNANANIGTTVVWDQYAFALGYSFNTAGTELTLTFPAPVYVKCTPQANGSAIIDSTEPYVQGLPNTADGKIYIYLGMAYSATNIELVIDNPVYFHDGNRIKLWTGTVIPTKTSDLTNDSGFLTSHQDISGKADKATTLSGYGITDAKIASGTITLGSNTITPLTSSSTLSAAKLSGAIPSAVTATTQASTDNSTKIATTAYVKTAIANLPEPADFIVATGTDGGWEYRKWNSGVYDAWQNISYTVAVQTSAGSMYTNADSIQIDFPSFHDEDSTYTLSLLGNGSDILVGNAFSAAFATFKVFRAQSRGSGSRAAKATLHGKWV